MDWSLLEWVTIHELLCKRVLEVTASVQKSAEQVRDRFSYLRETQHLLQIIRSSNALCQIHKLFSEVPDACDPQQVGCHDAQKITPLVQVAHS